MPSNILQELLPNACLCFWTFCLLSYLSDLAEREGKQVIIPLFLSTGLKYTVTYKFSSWPYPVPLVLQSQKYFRGLRKLKNHSKHLPSHSLKPHREKKSIPTPAIVIILGSFNFCYQMPLCLGLFFSQLFLIYAFLFLVVATLNTLLKPFMSFIVY